MTSKKASIILKLTSEGTNSYNPFDQYASKWNQRNFPLKLSVLTYQ